MASPFQKYQGEQVQQIAPGFVEAYGRAGQSIGAGIASFADQAAKGFEAAEERRNQEAKIRGSLAPYLKADNRTKAVELALKTGEIEKAEDGTVNIRPDLTELMTPQAQDAIDFYNKTGGDGSRLQGNDLVEFATRLQAQKAYDAELAAQDTARLERLKAQAEIDKIYADIDAKAGAATRGQILGTFASGGDVSGVSAPSPVRRPSMEAPRTGVSPFLFPAQQISEPEALTPTTPTRYSSPVAPAKPVPGAPANAPLAAPVPAPTTAQTLGKVPVPAPAKAPEVKAPAPTPVTFVSVTGRGEKLQPVIGELEQTPFVRTAATVRYEERTKAIDAQFSLAMAKLTSMGATPEEIKSLRETYDAKRKFAKESYDVEIANIESRVTAAQGIATETRAAAGETRAAAGETRAVAAEGRAVAEEGRKVAGEARAATEFGVQFGTPAQKQGAASASKPGTLQRKIDDTIRDRSTIRDPQGNILVGGQKQVELRTAAEKDVREKLSVYPAWWPSGIVSRAGAEYQFELKDFPTGKPISPAVAPRVNELVEGYAESREYMVTLKKAVEAKDESRVKEYLNRFLLLTKTDKEYFTGEQLQQFGVAAFRKGFVSGGNFSDKDREFVQDALVKLNTINPIKDKDKFNAQAQALAEFLDKKYRATLSANEIYVDIPTAKKFLEREGRTEELDRLKAAEEFYKLYRISGGAGETQKAAIADDPAALRRRAAELQSSNPKLSETYLRRAQEIEARKTK
jgi:hypothetical protein